MKTLALLATCAALQGCAAALIIAAPPIALNVLPCIAYAPQWECLTPEEGPINWRTPEERLALRDAFSARMAAALAARAPMLGE